MTLRLQALRLAILLGYLATGFGVAYYLIGPYSFLAWPLVVIGLEPAFNWVTNERQNARMRASMQAVGSDALTSDQMDWSFKQIRPTVIDDDPEWGKLVEGTDRVFGRALTAVQVTNSTPEPDGTYKQVWLRVPARGDRQGRRACTVCQRDIAWAPRTAREAIAWGFRLCVEHYAPSKAS